MPELSGKISESTIRARSSSALSRDYSRHGTNLTHKKIIIEQFVRNIPTPEIAGRTSHSEEACDRYIKGFKKVQKPHGDGIPEENIASELEMSKSLVREYFEIIKDLAKDKKG